MTVNDALEFIRLNECNELRERLLLFGGSYKWDEEGENKDILPQITYYVEDGEWHDAYITEVSLKYDKIFLTACDFVTSDYIDLSEFDIFTPGDYHEILSHILEVNS